MSPPLQGVRVLDLTRLLPGGYATLLLADLGADVIKVEEPGKGDYVRWSPPSVGEFSAAHVALNRNKRSVALNLKADAGRDAFAALAEASDVVVESFRPGVMARLGLGFDVLSTRNPRLVYCAITGYGQDGPRAGEAGHDANYIAYAGALGLTGAEDGAPVLPGLQIGDLGGGGMAAVIAVLAALRSREATGRGEFCDVAMMDGVVSWLSMHAAAFFATGALPERGRMPLTGAYPCYRVYRAADGHLAVGALEPQFWAELCSALDRSDLVDDGYAVGPRRDKVVAELEEMFATRTRAEWMELFGGRDVCVAPVNDLDEVAQDAQVTARAMVVEDEIEAGVSFRHIGNPIRVGSRGDRLVKKRPPRLGEHTIELLTEIGWGERVDALRIAGAI